MEDEPLKTTNFQVDFWEVLYVLCTVGIHLKLDFFSNETPI